MSDEADSRIGFPVTAVGVADALANPDSVYIVAMSDKGKQGFVPLPLFIYSHSVKRLQDELNQQAQGLRSRCSATFRQ